MGRSGLDSGGLEEERGGFLLEAKGMNRAELEEARVGCQTGPRERVRNALGERMRMGECSAATRRS